MRKITLVNKMVKKIEQSVTLDELEKKASDRSLNNPLRLITNRTCHGIIYRLFDDYVLKLHNSEYKKDELIDHEFVISTGLYKGGILVPKPIGLLELSRETLCSLGIDLPEEVSEGKLEKGLVMEYISGINGKVASKGRPNLSKRIIDLAKLELKKSIDLGYKPSDLKLSNVMYTINPERVYLIDFVKWQEPEK